MGNSRLTADFVSMNLVLCQLAIVFLTAERQLTRQLSNSYVCSPHQRQVFSRQQPIQPQLSTAIYRYQSSYLSRHSYPSISIQLARYIQLVKSTWLVTHQAERNQSALQFDFRQRCFNSRILFRIYIASYVDDHGYMGTLSNQPFEKMHPMASYIFVLLHHVHAGTKFHCCMHQFLILLLVILIVYQYN